jgi:hypothetical protein
VASSNIHLFGTSSQVLTVDSQDNEGDSSNDDDEGVSSEDEDDADGSEDEEENEEDITPDGRR